MAGLSGVPKRGEGKLVKTLPAGAFKSLSELLKPSTSTGKDWKLLADLLGFSHEEILSFGCEDEPVTKVLTKWTLLKHERATVDKLVGYLESIGRLDAVEELDRYIDKALTIEEYRTKQHEFQSASRSVVTSPSTLNESYDVFLSYAKADVEFAKEIVSTLEDQYNITVCIDFRDFLPGFHHLDQIVDAIETRCRRVVVILSPDYVDCEKCDFQAKVAMSLSPGARKRILIPVLYRKCELPSVFRGIYFMNYLDEDCRQNMWQKLSTSIKNN